MALEQLASSPITWPDMLTIRREQMKALNDYMEGILEVRLARRLALRFPDKVKTLPPPTGETDPQPAVAFVRRGAIKAQQFGVSSATDVAAFLDLQMMLGPEFTRQLEYLWILRILDSKTFPPESRMRVIFQRLPLRIPDHANLIYPTEKEV
jgi:hypothetical protein